MRRTPPCSAIGLILTLALAMLVALRPADAQHAGKVSHVGILSFSDEPSPGGEASQTRRVLEQALRDRGYVEGQNIRVEWRSADQRVDRLRDLAGELVRLKADVIVALGDDA